MIELFKMFTDSNYIDVSTFFTLEEEDVIRKEWVEGIGEGRKKRKD